MNKFALVAGLAVGLAGCEKESVPEAAEQAANEQEGFYYLAGPGESMDMVKVGKEFACAAVVRGDLWFIVYGPLQGPETENKEISVSGLPEAVRKMMEIC